MNTGTTLDASLHSLIYMLYRNAQRVLHIPFFEVESTLPHSQRLEVEMKLKQEMEYSSSAIGTMIKLGKSLRSQGSMDILENELMPFVTDCLAPLSYRVTKGYAMLMLAAQLVSFNNFAISINFLFQLCEQSNPDVIKFTDFKAFFRTTWAPLIVKLHLANGESISELIDEITAGLSEMSNDEV